MMITAISEMLLTLQIIHTEFDQCGLREYFIVWIFFDYFGVLFYFDYLISVVLSFFTLCLLSKGTFCLCMCFMLLLKMGHQPVCAVHTLGIFDSLATVLFSLIVL